MPLPPTVILDFSGGMRQDRDDYVKADNEVVRIINFDAEYPGKLKKVLGSHQMGDTASGNPINGSFYWEAGTLGASPTTFHLINEGTGAPKVFNIIGSRNTNVLTTASGTITLDDASGFDDTGSDDAEIEGDLFSYTGKAGNNLTGVTGLTSSHAIGNAVHQLDQIGGRALNTGSLSGLYYAALTDGTDDVLLMKGDGSSADYWDGSALTEVNDTDEPGGLFATVYRQRVYVAGHGAAAGVGIRNTQRDRVSYSEPGSVSDWGDYLVNFFDVKDDRGEIITGLKVSRADELLIFKTNSFFAYNEVNLKQRSIEVGAYNHFVAQEIDGNIFTFCPEGIFVTDGRSVKNISEPVEDWIKDFRPSTSASTLNRVVTNTFATVYDKRYMLYVGDVTSPGTFSDVVLVYDTRPGNWSVYTGMTNFAHLRGFQVFNYGGARQKREGLFGGNDSGQYFRFYSKSYVDADGNSRFATGDEIFQSLVSDTGSIISSELQTGLKDQKLPGILKQFKYLRVLAKDKGFHISFRVEDKKGLSDWISLGENKHSNHRFRLPKEAKGYRIAVRATHSDSNNAPTLNGLILEETEVLQDTR